MVALLIGLGCSGLTGEVPGIGGGGKGSAADTSKLKVGASNLTRGGSTEKMPTGSTVERHRKRELYVVKLAEGVESLSLGEGLKTGRARFDDSVGSLSIRESRKVHREGAKRKDVADQLGLSRTVRIRTARDPEEVVARLEAHDEVEWVEPVSEVRNSAAPNDPYWQYQWHLQMLQVDKAWEITQGEGVVVAVVDTGVSKNEDGFYKLLKGKDFVDGDTNPEDENGHGSHVAGTIAQASGNGIGTAGVAPKVSILPVRVLDANGSGDNTDVAEGIIWAVDNGAHIINLSLGSPMNSEAVADAVAYAYENDVTVVAATGNDGYTDFIGFPAALPTPIAVGSVDTKRNVAFYSNQGREIDLVAPGGDSTVDLNGDGQVDGVLQETRLGGTWAYHFLQGTSMATPHVAGAAALVYANGVKSPEAIKEILTGTATDLGAGGWDSVYGYGLVNPLAALGEKAGPPRQARRGKGGKGGKAGGGGDDGDGSLVISNTRVKKAGNSRAVISFTTNEAARSMVKGDGGFERKNSTPTKSHQFTVTGKPGQTLAFTIGAATESQDKAREEVTVNF